MTLQLLPLEESEFGIFIKIAWEVFHDDIFKAFFPGGPTPEIEAHQIKEGVKEWRENPSGQRYMKVIDTTLPNDDEYGRILGVAKWTVIDHERTEEEIKAEKEKEAANPPTFPPGANVEYMKKFFETAGNLREKAVGNKPCFYLEVLATRPTHHRRGAGAMQLKWGLEEADKLGAVAYLESSPTGRPLYKRFGFEDVEPFPEFCREYGVDMDLEAMCMFRPASSREE